MSGPVDVLAVLDRQVERSYNPFEPDNQASWYPQLCEAREAVAELISAVKNKRAVYANPDKAPNWAFRNANADTRLDAALVRVGAA